MSNALTAVDTQPGLGNPLRQAAGLLGQPAVKRALPILFLVGLIAAGWLAWSMVATSPQRILFANLGDADKASVTSALEGANIDSAIERASSVSRAWRRRSPSTARETPIGSWSRIW